MNSTRLVVAVAVLALGCAGPAPVVEHRTHQVVAGGLAKVAVAPFHASPLLAANSAPSSASNAESAVRPPADSALVLSRIVAEAFTAAGYVVIPPSDLAKGFDARGTNVPRRDVQATAALAARDFGATAIVVGQLVRYREREGGPAGALRPASAHFELAVHSAPGGVLLYTARFDQTQHAISADPLTAAQYPGGGTRWLTVAELVRWGADRAVAALPQAMR